MLRLLTPLSIAAPATSVRALSSVLLIASAVSAEWPGARLDSSPDEILPEAVEVILPCCPPGPEYDRFPAVPTLEQSPPEGRPVDEATYLRLKEISRFSPLVPEGREVGVEEDARSEIQQEYTGSSAPKTKSKFDGLAMKESGNGFPPDTQIAVGPKHLLQAVNVALRLSNKSNGNVVLQALRHHFGLGLFTNIFDPKVYYDEFSGRFFVVAVEVNFTLSESYIWLSVSQSDEPTSLSEGWCNYRINSKKGKAWGDYPGLGMNEDWLAIGTNHFTFSDFTFRGAHLWVANKAKLVENESKCPKLKLFKFTAKKDASGEEAFTIQSAQHYSETGMAGNPLFLVSTQCCDVHDEYVLWRIKAKSGKAPEPTAASKPKLSRVNLEGETYALPPLADQKGTPFQLDSGDTRVTQQVPFIDGEIWFSFGTACNIGGVPNESCTRVVKIVPDEKSGTIDFEDTFGKKNWFLFWPGIGVADNGDAVAVYQQSSSNNYLSVAFNGMKAAKSQFDKIKFLSKGTCPAEHLAGGLGRTGDYVGVQPDPAGSKVFWISGEYSNEIGSDCDWLTKIARVQY